jgi:hypothetical protein
VASSSIYNLTRSSFEKNATLKFWAKHIHAQEKANKKTVPKARETMIDVQKRWM